MVDLTILYKGCRKCHSGLVGFKNIEHIYYMNNPKYRKVVGECCHCHETKTKEYCRACLLQ